MENTESRAMPEKYLTNSFADDGLIELTDDFVLPEHLDDAKKIIRGEGTLRPGGLYISGQEVEYEGEMVYSVLYITDGNSLKNVVFKAKYARKILVPNVSESSVMNVFPSFDSVECKLVNPRKMNLRCRVLLHFQMVSEESCAPEFIGDTPDEDAASCESQKSMARFVKAAAVEKKENRVSRDFEPVSYTHLPCLRPGSTAASCLCRCCPLSMILLKISRALLKKPQPQARNGSRPAGPLR